MGNDLTRGKPAKILLAFSLPMLAGNLIQQFYNMVDLVIVGRFVGVNALAAVGATGSTMFFIFSLVVGLTNGASVVVSQYYGYGDKEKTRRTVAISVCLLAVAAIFLTIFGAVIAEPVLRLMQTPDEILDGAVGYLRIIFLGVSATVAYNGAANLIRAVGDSITPLIFLIVAVVLNIFLDYLFVVPFAMGVEGAAWATVIAQGVSAVGCILYAGRKIPILRLKRSDFRYDGEILRQTIKLGIPGGIQNSLIAIGSMSVQSVVNTFGAVVVAAYAAAVKLDQLAVQPLLALSMGSATYTAQNMGAGKIMRVKQGFWAAVLMSSAFSVLVTVILFLFGGNLMALFMDSGEASTGVVLEIGQGYLRIASVFYVILGLVILLENVLRGTGDVFAPVISNIGEIVVRITFANILAASLGYEGIWWSTPLSWAVGTIICGIRFLSGKWQYKALVPGTPDHPLSDTVEQRREVSL